MGKTKKLGKLGGKVSRPGPLGDQISRDETARPTTRVKVRGGCKEEDQFVASSLSKTILKQSLAQLQEIEDETEEMVDITNVEKSQLKSGRSNQIFLGPDVASHDKESSDEQDIDETEGALPQSVDKCMNEFEKDLNIAAEDLKALDHFMKKDAGPQRKLADLFKDKITEKKTEIRTQVDADSVQTMSVSPEIQEMCKEVGKVLSRYRSGVLPKMFKVMPKMRCWEELVYLTVPEKWSAAAMYQAVRIFASNMKEPMAQRFYNLVFLPRVRDDIAYYKRLNYHLYQGLCKSLFKPAAFFKGILLPLCMSGNCTLQEAIIIGSVLAKAHIPILHSAAAILKIAEMDYTGPNSIFLRILFDKKYALPYRVLDACVYHYIKFQHDKRDLPVLWHQSLLTFLQRYKDDISSDQKEALQELVKWHTHFSITPEIRRELAHSKNRGESVQMEDM